VRHSSAKDVTELRLKTHYGRADAFGTRQSMMQQVQAASTTMNLLRRAVSVALIALIVIGSAIVPVSAKSEDTNWNEVKKLRRGQQVQVVLSDARDYQGAFERWSDSEIVIRPASAEQTFARPDVIRIVLIRKRSRLKHSLTGAGIGAGVGLIVGAVADRGCGNSCWFPDIAKAVFTPLGGIIGAGIGVALPTGGSKVIYRAP